MAKDIAKLIPRLREFWIGEADLAPVALFRILYGVQLFNWIWQLYPNLAAFFTDEGILPRRSLLATYGDRFSLLNLVGEWWQVAAFWLLSLGVAVLLAVGWRSRIAALAAFIVVSSFSWRDPLILDGSDFVFRVVPLWLAFTDCGARFSLDALGRARRGEPNTGRGPALPVRILELQIAWIYLATGLEKLGGELWPSGIAPYYALQLEHTFGRSWARPVATSMALVPLISWATLVIEIAFLPLTLLPSRITRLVAVAGAAGLHLGIALLMNVGNFPVIMLSALVLFVPAAPIERTVRRVALWTGLLRRLGPVADMAIAALPQRRGVPVRPGMRSWGGTALACFALLAMATAVPSQLETLRPSGDLASLLRFLSVDQRWDMFSPEPARADGWMRMPAVLQDGTRLDLLTGGPADDSSERYSDALYTRWVKVQERIASAAYSDYRLEYARHFCRSRNLHLRPGDIALDRFEILYVERVIRPPGEGPPTFRERSLWSHTC